MSPTIENSVHGTFTSNTDWDQIGLSLYQ